MTMSDQNSKSTSDGLGDHELTLNKNMVSKTKTLTDKLSKQINCGNGVIYVDDHLDTTVLQLIRECCKSINREDDFVILDPVTKAFFQQYNCVMNGHPDDIAARLLLLLPFTENSDGATYYEEVAKEAVAIIISAFQTVGLNYGFAELINIFTDPRELMHLAQIIPETPEFKKSIKDRLIEFIEKYSSIDNDSLKESSIQMMKEHFGGLVSRMQMQLEIEEDSLSDESHEEFIPEYRYKVEISQAIQEGKILYIVYPNETNYLNAGLLHRSRLMLADLVKSIDRAKSVNLEKDEMLPNLAIFDVKKLISDFKTNKEFARAF